MTTVGARNVDLAQDPGAFSPFPYTCVARLQTSIVTRPNSLLIYPNSIQVVCDLGVLQGTTERAIAMAPLTIFYGQKLAIRNLESLRIFWIIMWKYRQGQ